MDIQHTYGFEALFEGGESIIHDPEVPNSDVSQKFEGKTIFTDVLEKEKESALLRFTISDGSTTASVDLTDGHFEINGVSFFQHRPDLDRYKDFRVIYYRTVRRTLNQVSGEQLDAEILGYTIGWQVTHQGQNVQRTITI